MELLKSLGVNSTIWVHAACFAVAYLALTQLIFKPYLKALTERETRTVGGEEKATQLLMQAAEINNDYEAKAKAVTASIRTEYDKSRVEAMKESEALVESARAEASRAVESARKKITTEIERARGTLAGEIPAITAAIASKMAGKEIAL